MSLLRLVYLFASEKLQGTYHLLFNYIYKTTYFNYNFFFERNLQSLIDSLYESKGNQ
jgi:hypothetical protein